MYEINDGKIGPTDLQVCRSKLDDLCSTVEAIANSCQMLATSKRTTYWVPKDLQSGFQIITEELNLAVATARED